MSRVPGLAVWKGDQVAACVAAASVLAKVTRDRLMVELDSTFPEYGFAEHKGYVTPEHSAALRQHGPCREHRFSYVNVAAVSGAGLQPLATMEQDPSVGGTVGVAWGTRRRPPSPVGEDVAMEGGGR